MPYWNCRLKVLTLQSLMLINLLIRLLPNLLRQLPPHIVVYSGDDATGLALMLMGVLLLGALCLD